NKRPATEAPPTQAPPSKVGRPLLSTPGGVPPPALMDLNGGAAPQGQQQHFGGGPPQQQMMNGNNGFNGPMMDFQNDDFAVDVHQKFVKSTTELFRVVAILS
uniref:Uncharacterized protein n=1 Tax=Romanomermis culicivorax TaxID=13658 RepID=A0A915JHP5_ROMCU